MKTIYLIGGTMGVGKTAVCQQLKRELPNSVFLDGDWCWDAHPFQVTEETKGMVLDNICYLLNNFIGCSAYEHIIFCWVMHEQKIVDSILDRLHTEGCALKLISLICDEASLRERLEKDIKRGVRTADVVERSAARLPLYRDMETVPVDTSNKSIFEVAQEILKL